MSLNQSDLKDLAASIDLSSLHEDVRKYIDQLKKDLDDSKESYDLLSKNLASRNKIIQNLESNQQLQKKRYTRLQEKFNDQTLELNRTLQDLKSIKAAEASRIILPNTDQIQQLRKEYKQDEKRKTLIIQNLEEELNRIKSQLSNQIQENGKKQIQFNSLINSFKLINLRCKTKYQNFKILVENCKKIKILFQKNLNLHQMIQIWKKKKLQASQQKSQLLKKIFDLQKQLKTINAQLTESNKQNKEIKNKYQRLQETLQKLRDKQEKSDYQPQSQTHLQTKKRDLDEDLAQNSFPTPHQEAVQNIVNYIKGIHNSKEKLTFLNIIGALSENQIEQISNKVLQESD